jgi:hypothetical protein
MALAEIAALPVSDDCVLVLWTRQNHDEATCE